MQTLHLFGMLPAFPITGKKQTFLKFFENSWLFVMTFVSGLNFVCCFTNREFGLK